MVFRFLALLISSSILFFLSCLQGNALSYTFTPGPQIALSWGTSSVYFDVWWAIVASGSTVPAPYLDTTTREFHGAFYLSGAGWVDFSTGSYSVTLDCGVQSLSSLTFPCSVIGTAYGELVGDVVFSSVTFDPNSWILSWSLDTFIWSFMISGGSLPILPTFFSWSLTSIANHTESLMLSWATRISGVGDWDVYVAPLLGSDTRCSGPTGIIVECDFSMAGEYSVTIIDPNNSETKFAYSVTPGIPSTLYSTAQSTLHGTFCTSSPTDTRCPDGATLTGMTLSRTPSSATMIANGLDTYAMRLRIRDQYGNAVNTGSITLSYITEIRADQISPLDMIEPTFFSSTFSWSAIIHSGGILIDNFDGTATSPDMDLSIPGDVAYRLAAIAPTNLTTDTLSLSGIVYTFPDGVRQDITDPAWRSPLSFDPWYTTSLTVTSPIVVGTGVGFSWSLISHDISISPTALSSVYHLAIGGWVSAAFTDFVTDTPPSCTKYIFPATGTRECNWWDSGTWPVVISTMTAFTGTYTPIIPNPPLESISYKSYITYEIGGIPVLYPSASGNLGWAAYGQSPLRILGQSNVTWQYGGIGSRGRADFWNATRKNIALLSRNRTTYTDVDYSVFTGSSLMITDASFTDKRTLIVIGGDIHITENIAKRPHPLALIALTDEAGNGGDIIIDPSVTNIDTSLFAEHGITSSGTSQFAILGSLISANTVGWASTTPETCASFISVCSPVLAAKYDLEKLRPDFDKDTSTKASGPTASTHPWVATIIEYDGRILSDPPPVLEK